MEGFRVFNISSNNLPFFSDIITTAISYGLFYASAGVTGGLTYWLVEFSSFIGAIIWFFSNPRPLRWTGGLLSWRATSSIAAALLVAAMVPAARWWWQPHVHQSSAAEVPRVAFEGEWAMKGNLEFLTWTVDGSRLISLSSNGDWLAVQDRHGTVDQEKKVPLAMAARAAGNQRLIAVPEQNGSAAFAVLDVGTSEVLHREPDPVPGKPGMASAAVALALSPDGTTLAVGYGSPKAGLPVSLLSTQDWHTVSSFDSGVGQLLGARLVAFSNDGSRLAVAGWDVLVVCDVGTGAVLRRIPVRASGVSFSPDSSLIAIVADRRARTGVVASRSIYLFRLSDGVEVASREAGAGYIASLLWDRQARFIVFGVDGANGVHLWNPSAPAASDVTIQLRPFSGGLALSPDGNLLAVGNDEVVSLFRIRR